MFGPAEISVSETVGGKWIKILSGFRIWRFGIFWFVQDSFESVKEGK